MFDGTDNFILSPSVATRPYIRISHVLGVKSTICFRSTVTTQSKFNIVIVIVNHNTIAIFFIHFFGSKVLGRLFRSFLVSDVGEVRAAAHFSFSLVMT